MKTGKGSAADSQKSSASDDSDTKALLNPNAAKDAEELTAGEMKDLIDPNGTGDVLPLGE